MEQSLRFWRQAVLYAAPPVVVVLVILVSLFAYNKLTAGPTKYCPDNSGKGDLLSSIPIPC